MASYGLINLHYHNLEFALVPFLTLGLVRQPEFNALCSCLMCLCSLQTMYTYQQMNHMGQFKRVWAAINPSCEHSNQTLYCPFLSFIAIINKIIELTGLENVMCKYVQGVNDNEIKPQHPWIWIETCKFHREPGWSFFMDAVYDYKCLQIKRIFFFFFYHPLQCELSDCGVGN